MASKLTVLSREWCHLCDELVEALRPLALELGLDIEVIDDDLDPSLEERWGELVPVVLSGQTELVLAEAKKQGAVLPYGSFITVAINFIILAFIIFMMVKQVNRLKREAPAAPPAPPAPPPEDVVLLREIRDALKRQA